jgi:hypothetical protein
MCLDVNRGLEIAWESEDEHYAEYFTAIASNGRILITSIDGWLHLLEKNGRKHHVISRIDMFPGLSEKQRKTWSHPALVGNRYFIRNQAAAYCFQLLLQHHFAIGEFSGLSHTGWIGVRAGQFGVSWKSLGGLDHGYDRTARRGGTVDEVARAFCILLRTAREPGAFLGISAGIASGDRSQEHRADGPGLRRFRIGPAGNRTTRCLGVATLPHGLALGG